MAKSAKKTEVTTNCRKSVVKRTANLNRSGRKKGSKNKYSSDVKKMVLDALNAKGGMEFFNKLDDRDFVRVAAKLIPQVIDANVTGDMTQTVNIITSGKGKEK